MYLKTIEPCTINDLFFVRPEIKKPGKRRSKRKSCPVDYVSYKSIVLSCINQINQNAAEDFFIEKYGYYVDHFYCWIGHPGPSDLGFYSKTTMNVNYYLTRGWSQEESIKILKDWQNQTSLDKFVVKYGEIEGPRRFTEYKIKHGTSFKNGYYEGKHKVFLRPSQLGYWTNQGLDESDARKSMIEYYSKIGKDYFKKRKEDGKEFLTVRQLKFWINRGLSKEDAREQLRKIQNTRSLDHYVELYGKEIGALKFKETNDRWLKTLNSKTDEEKLDILIRKTKRSKRYSKKSIDLFESVFKALKKDHGISFDKIYLAENEYYVYDQEKKKINFYDLCIKEISLIVEYNGNMFHPNKSLLSENEWKAWINPISKTTADEQNSIDEYKRRLAESRGFNYLIIWENETFEYSKNIMINKMLELYGRKND